MITRQGWPIGICSWSLGCGHDGMAVAMKELGIAHVHLEFKRRPQPDWVVTSTMVGFPQEDYSTLDSIRRTGGIAPDAAWAGNRKVFSEAAKVTADIGVKFLSMHAGFIDHTDASYAAKFHDRIRDLADIAGELGITVLLETGQESAADLRRFMETLNHPALGINFDPANMILYDKDEPKSAVRILAPWVRHVHIKDALRTKVPGQWGREVPWGTGEVDAKEFISALQATGYQGALAIEREGGGSRMADIKSAIQLLMA
jgi:L-ribulose-5-phosphate 3-epimerase